MLQLTAHVSTAVKSWFDSLNVLVHKSLVFMSIWPKWFVGIICRQVSIFLTCIGGGELGLFISVWLISCASDRLVYFHACSVLGLGKDIPILRVCWLNQWDVDWVEIYCSTGGSKKLRRFSPSPTESLMPCFNIVSCFESICSLF